MPRIPQAELDRLKREVSLVRLIGLQGWVFRPNVTDDSGRT
jgi:hypothetical protein